MVTSERITPAQEKSVLLATIMASSMAFIDGSALNVALPALQRGLDMTGAQLLWVINIYALFLSALLLVGGSLGDLYGRRRIFILGIGLFTIASMICGLAQSPLMLILARAVQGMGGALMVPGSLSIISALFPAGKRGKAIGVWATFSALTTVIGPVLGGWLAGAGLWRMIFFINLPIALASIYFLRRVPETRNPEAGRLDWGGAILATFGLGGLSYGFIQAPDWGWSHPSIQLGLIGGAAALLLFIWWERRIPFPMMPPRLFRFRTFNAANVLTLLVYFSFGGLLFFLPLNLIQVQGYSEQVTGLAILPFALLISGLSRVMGSLVDRVGSRPLLVAGPLITGIGCFLFSLPGLTDGFSDYWRTFFPALVVIGVGMGITVAPLTSTVMGCVPENSYGAASGVNNAISRTASVFAIAILGAIALVSFRNELLAETQRLGLSEKVEQSLSREAANFAKAEPPASTPAEERPQVERAIKKSFVYTFNRIVWIGAFLCGVSALIAGWYI